MLAPPDLEQFRADVEADALVAGAREQRREGARATAEIDDPRAGFQPCEIDEGLGEPRARLRREHVVIVGRRMAVEECDFFLLVLGWCSHGAISSACRSDAVALSVTAGFVPCRPRTQALRASGKLGPNAHPCVAAASLGAVAAAGK